MYNGRENREKATMRVSSRSEYEVVMGWSLGSFLFGKKQKIP